MLSSLSGRLADFALPQVLMLLESMRSSGYLQVRGPEAEGRLSFVQGQIVAAKVGLLRGDIAVYSVFNCRAGEFELFKEAPSAAVEAELQDSRCAIHRSNQGLILEAARLDDETRNSRNAFAPLGAVDPAELQEDLQQVWLSLNGATPLQWVSQSCGISMLEALYRLEQLEQLGAVERKSLEAISVLSSAAPRARLLVVDDSGLMQKVLTRIYETASEVEVVGHASNGREALEMLSRLKPDVISLDLYMPVMDGVTTLKHIMVSQPTPTVIVTSANPEDLDLTFESILRFGAIDFVTKPSRTRGPMEEQAENIVRRICKAARVNLRGLRMFQPPARVIDVHALRSQCQSLIVAVGGTGACLSCMQFLTSLSPDLPFGIIGVLPFSQPFLQAFVSFLKKCSTFNIELARDGALLQSGTCYLSSRLDTLTLCRGAEGLMLQVVEGRRDVNANALLLDVATHFRERGIALLLSGEGDGALDGLSAVRAAGGIAMAQLPTSCVDPEQSKKACDLSLIDRVVMLPQISTELSQFLQLRPNGTLARTGS